MTDQANLGAPAFEIEVRRIPIAVAVSVRTGGPADGFDLLPRDSRPEAFNSGLSPIEFLCLSPLANIWTESVGYSAASKQKQQVPNLRITGVRFLRVSVPRAAQG